MTKLLSLAAVIGVSFFCVATAESMPLAPLEQAQASLTIPVAGGCGPGFHPGPYGGSGQTAAILFSCCVTSATTDCVASPV